jgi:hypothetical protein
MKLDLSFKASGTIENLLAKLGNAEAENQDSETGISDFIFDDPQAYDPLLKAIFQNKYIAEHYDADTIVELLHHSYYRSKPKTGKEYLQAFKDIFQNVKNDWVSLIPLDYNRPFAKPKFFRPLKLGHCMITPPLRKEHRFASFLRSTFGVASVDESLLDHQLRQTRGFLYSAPLLTFEVHGPRVVAQQNAQSTLRLFRQLHNLYTANFGERSTLTTIDQQLHPVSHGFLLDSKWGEVYRYPLREGSQLLTRLNPTQIRHFIKRDFVALLSLMGEKTASDRLRKRMLRALHFFSKGFNERDILSRFLFYLISAEALFSKDRDTPISATLADYTSLISAASKDRLATHQRLRKLYGIRSSIVHSGETDVSKQDVADAERFVSRTLLKGMRSLLPPIQIKSEDEFFEELRKLKLHLKSRLSTRP